MGNRTIYIGNQKLHSQSVAVKEVPVLIDGKPFYGISGFDQMQPFLISLVSNSNHWMYLSSRGGLSCGRQNPDHALFPYYTDDKIHDASDNTGPLTRILVDRGDGFRLWSPFSDGCSGIYGIERRLYKSVYGNQIIFEEINNNLELSFSYSWEFGDRFGFIRTCRLSNTASAAVNLGILDGIQNVLPAGVQRISQERISTLLDGYKKCELTPESSLAIYSLSSIVTDRAEPSESLKASTVWSAGLPDQRILLSTDQIREFETGGDVITETEKVGRRGAYLVSSSITLESGKEQRWTIAADVEQTVSDCELTLSFLQSGEDALPVVDEDIDRGSDSLMRLVASSDGFQASNDRLTTGRHYSNVLFNIMRGGIFVDGYKINSAEFRGFIERWNRPILLANGDFFEALPSEITLQELSERARDAGNPDLIRLTLEYLPIFFSRRHGDPSRPWNMFSIDLMNPDGSRSLSYQGNWRDIFQNWEALAFSYPGYLDGMIAKFLNASTADGYNPYRISNEGIDWEVLDPDDPWSNIGYWGDHQIIYLLRLMELSADYSPGSLEESLDDQIFAYADVPYRIKPFDKMIINPQETIDFDSERHKRSGERVSEKGSDGKLLHADGDVYHVTLIEKILVTLLAKMSNLVPDGGVWMNTQRPEWNDANNALVGWGLSMVTLSHLRRFIVFLTNLFTGRDSGKMTVLTVEVKTLMNRIFGTLEEFRSASGSMNGESRLSFVRALGEAGTAYRSSLYSGKFGSQTATVSLGQIHELLSICLDYVDKTIRANKRDDGLYHSYNLMVYRAGSIDISHLDVMLEGQVAVLDSGLLSSEEALHVLKTLKASALYRPDQNSYTLYPDKTLPQFLEKNRVMPQQIEESEFLLSEAKRKDGRLIQMDINGKLHFNSSFRNIGNLEQALEQIEAQDGNAISEDERNFVKGLYEETFNHKEFTGRSQTFFKYEGLGSIYWHMVSKLVLAAQRNYTDAAADGSSKSLTDQLADLFHDIREGIGVHKSPLLYGAFSTDPYSHTPIFAGVQQPGMTGQVKEDIIARFGELGIEVNDGCLSFNPTLLRNEEFLSKPSEFTYLDLKGEWQKIQMEPGTLGFTYCQIPVVYRLSDQYTTNLRKAGGGDESVPGNVLSRDRSQSIFNREGVVTQIEVAITFDNVGTN